MEQRRAERGALVGHERLTVEAERETKHAGVGGAPRLHVHSPIRPLYRGVQVRVEGEHVARCVVQPAVHLQGVGVGAVELQVAGDLEARIGAEVEAHQPAVALAAEDEGIRLEEE